jgi:hypothetical protein
MTATFEHAHDEFYAAAVRAFRTSTAADALDALDWWHLLTELNDPERRAAVFAVFRAQGRVLSSSIALGALMARPYVEVSGRAVEPLVATLVRDSRRRGAVDVVVGNATGSRLLVDRPGSGAMILDPEDVELRPVDIPGRLELHEVDIRVARWHASIGENEARRARRWSALVGRTALALEILGAAEGALALALEHATARQQFGKPIASFQAVRHLLAWAACDCAALGRTAAQTVALGRDAPVRFDEITKALAGRNGRRTCERTLQVLGAIGFTAEHAHHHFHARVLTLDSLLGTSADLMADLGGWLRELGGDPQIPLTLLLQDSRR